MTYQIESEPTPQRRSVVQSIWDVGVIVSLVILAISTQSGNFNPANVSSALRPINVNEVVNHSQNLRGRTVTIRSKAVQQIGASSFTLKDGLFALQEPVLVVNASGVPFNLPSDRNIDIQITGQVRDLSISDLERDYKLDLEAEQYSDYVNKPVIVAQNIMLAPQPNQVVQNPARYYGKTVTVTGEVNNITIPTLMTIHKKQVLRDRNLPVLLTSSPKVAINTGQRVAVVGEIRPFVISEIEQKYNLNWNQDIRRQLEAKYRNQPVLVAETVYP
ncbi:hypothetical protein NIES4101_80560 [Calothrix sp. NIES-4101]|nr:hypothetical protein NIES4101_80560 [Calothrix sp. NIES-4101]